MANSAPIHTSPGLFITFEGGEGSGKSTQARLLAEAFEQANQPCLLTREPGGTPQSEAIRQLVVTGDADRWMPISELMLFQAARVEHYYHKILPALEVGRAVVCDRFADSTRVYQGIAKGLSVELVDLFHTNSIGVWPHLTLLLDIDPAWGLARAGNRGGNETRFERHGVEFHQIIRQGFLTLAAQEPNRMHVLDGAQDALDLHRQILSVIQHRFGLALNAVRSDMVRI